MHKLLSRLHGVKRHNGFYRAFCPAHDDRNTPNLDISQGGDGRALLICRAGCTTEQVVSALGLELGDLFFRHGTTPNGKVGEGGGHDTPETLHACTLETYASSKRVPAEYLERLGLSGIRYAGRPAVRIPYRDPDGTETAVRFRLALHKDLEGDGRFRWRRGSNATRSWSGTA